MSTVLAAAVGGVVTAGLLVGVGAVDRGRSGGEAPAAASVHDLPATAAGGALDAEVLRDLQREAWGLDLDVLVEVHDGEELESALKVEAEVIGINNRDLGDFTVDIERTYELLSDIPTGKTVVSESGFSTREQLDELDRVGVDAVLVGETLMRAQDLEAACHELTGGAEEAGPGFAL